MGYITKTEFSRIGNPITKNLNHSTVYVRIYRDIWIDIRFRYQFWICISYSGHVPEKVSIKFTTSLHSQTSRHFLEGKFQGAQFSTVFNIESVKWCSKHDI